MNKHLAGDCHKTNMFEQDSGNMVLRHDSELQISVLERRCNESNYIASLNRRIFEQEHELTALKENHQHLMQLYLDSQNREKVLLRHLAIQERLLQNYATYHLTSHESSNPTLLDPCVNLIIQLLCKEVHELKRQLKETQNELTAWQFTPDSVNGKRLMARCIKLHKENEELGRVVSHGKLAKLEGELALYKSFSEEVKQSQAEMDTIVQELDEDVETMQSTIFSLVEQVEKRNASVKQLEAENKELQRSKNQLEQLQTANVELKATIAKLETMQIETKDTLKSKAATNIDEQEIQKLWEDEKSPVESDDDGLKYYQ